MSGLSFKLLSAAAGASGVANFIAPSFSIIPTYARNGSHGADIAPFNITTLAEDVYAISTRKTSTTGSGSAPVVSLWSGTPEGGSVFSILTYDTANTFHSPNIYNDSDFSDFSLEQYLFYSFDSSVPFPEPSGSISGRQFYQVIDPRGTTRTYTARARSGSHVMHTIRDAISSGEALVEKLTDGVSQFVYNYYVSGSSTIPKAIIPFSDGRFLFVTSKGSVMVNSSGGILWGKTTQSPLDDTLGIVSADNSYIYSSDKNGRFAYRINVSTGLEQDLDMASVASLSSSKTTNFTGGSKACERAVAEDSNGNIWTIGNGGNADTLACFQPNGTFVRKYSIDNVGSSVRIDLRSLAVDGDYVIVGGVIAATSTYVRNAFVAKLAVDGTSTGTGYVGIPSSPDPSALQISVLSSNSDAGSYSWETTSQATVSFSRRTVSGYSLQTALETATSFQSDPATQVISL